MVELPEDKLQDFRAKKAEAIARLDVLQAEYDGFDLIAWLAILNLGMDPETYSESSHQGSAASLEYAILRLLGHEYSEGTGAPGPRDSLAEIVDLSQGLSISGLVEDLRKWMEHPEARGNADNLDELRFVMRTHEQLVRADAYPHHQDEILLALFAPFGDVLRATVGFDIQAALSVTTTLTDRTDEVWHAKLQIAREGMREVRKAIERARKKGDAGRPPEVPEELFESLRNLSAKDLRRAEKRFVMPIALHGLGKLLSFSADEISRDADLDSATVSAVLNHFSLGFGSITAPEYLDPVHPLKERPIARHRDRYICPIGDALRWALRTSLETVLKGNDRVWARYDRHRHDSLLRIALRQFGRIMPSATIGSNLYYPDPDRGPGNRAELDGLAVYDTAVFLVEAKAGALRPAARRGAREAFQDQVADLIRDPHEQALRAQRYINSERVAVFDDGSGVQLAVVSEAHERTYAITVTLESLGHVSAHFNQDSPFLVEGHDPSWTVSLSDLMVIGDILEGLPQWLPLYLDRRSRLLQQGKMVSADELDFFMMFLTRGLYFDEDSYDGADHVALGTMTDPLDHYYFYLAGIRKTPTRKPEPKRSPDVGQLVDRIEASQLPGRLEAALMLIMLGESAREDTMAMIEKARAASKRDGKMHSVTLQDRKDGEWGLTYVCSQRESDVDREQVKKYVAEKRRHVGVDQWVCFAELLSQPKRVWWIYRRSSRVG